eukprot:Skav222361  [mRNA]  locus=scaffold2692:40905:42582:+ [translate_table: standard]
MQAPEACLSCGMCAEAQPSAEHVAVGESAAPGGALRGTGRGFTVRLAEKRQGEEPEEKAQGEAHDLIGSEEAPPTPNRSDLGTDVQALDVMLQARQGSSSGTSPENLVKRVSSDDGSSSSGSSEVIERD